MKFIAHNHFNNNSFVAHEFEPAPGTSLYGEGSINITEEGVCFVLLNKRWRPQEKLAFIPRFHQRLQSEFGAGLAAVTFAESDCTGTVDKDGFFAAVKKIDPAIKTVHISAFRKSTADFVNEARDCDGVKDLILQAVQLTPGEKASEPAEGWSAFAKRLRDLQEQVYTDIRCDLAAADAGLEP